MKPESVIDFSSQQHESSQSEVLSPNQRKLRKAGLIAKQSAVFHYLKKEEQQEAVMHI